MSIWKVDLGAYAKYLVLILDFSVFVQVYIGHYIEATFTIDITIFADIQLFLLCKNFIYYSLAIGYLSLG